MKGGDLGTNELQSSSAFGTCGWNCEGHERGVRYNSQLKR